VGYQPANKIYVACTNEFLIGGILLGHDSMHSLHFYQGVQPNTKFLETRTVNTSGNTTECLKKYKKYLLK